MIHLYYKLANTVLLKRKLFKKAYKICIKQNYYTDCLQVSQNILYYLLETTLENFN